MSDIYAALAAVMTDCKSVAKRDRNEQQRFIFRGIDAVMNAVGPILRKHKVIVIPEVEQADYAEVKTSTGKVQMSCRLIIRYVFYAEDGSSVAARVAAEASDSGDKATPKAMAVGLRTALLQSLALPTDDPDPDSPKPKRGTTGPPKDEPTEGETRTMSRPPKSERQKREGEMWALFTKAGYDTKTEKDRMLAFIGRTIGREVASRTEMTDAELGDVITELQVVTAETPKEDS